MRICGIGTKTLRRHRVASWSRGLVCLATIGLLPTVAGNSQSKPSSGAGTGTVNSYPMGQSQSTRPQNNTTDVMDAVPDPAQAREDERRLKLWKVWRQKKMTSDTAKLLKLASELNSELGKTGKDAPSMGDVRKAEQIEKLAKDIRDNMQATLVN